MNKTILIVGGASVASLAAGAASGYFFAKKKFNAKLDDLIKVEVDAVKKYMSVQLMEARTKPEVIPVHVEEDEEEDLERSDEEILLVEKGKTALTNYQGVSLKPNTGDLASNIFTSANAGTKKPMPPRGEDGKFVSAAPVVEDNRGPAPFQISHDEFLLNHSGYDQHNYTYFLNDDTLLDYENEGVDLGIVGAVNMKLFAQLPEGAEKIICIRNEKLATDVEIRGLEESLTEYMGFGDGE